DLHDRVVVRWMRACAGCSIVFIVPGRIGENDGPSPFANRQRLCCRPEFCRTLLPTIVVCPDVERCAARRGFEELPLCLDGKPSGLLRLVDGEQPARDGLLYL